MQSQTWVQGFPSETGGLLCVLIFGEGRRQGCPHSQRPQVTLGLFNLPHPALGSIGQSGYQNHVGSNSILLRVTLALGSPTVYDLRIPNVLKLYIKEGTLSSDLSWSSQLWCDHKISGALLHLACRLAVGPVQPEHESQIHLTKGETWGYQATCELNSFHNDQVSVGKPPGLSELQCSYCEVKLRAVPASPGSPWRWWWRLPMLLPQRPRDYHLNIPSNKNIL